MDYGRSSFFARNWRQRRFFTLYGHLTKDTLSSLKAGQHIASRTAICARGSSDENGGWAPHIHFQIILDLLELGADFPGVAYASQRAVWTSSRRIQICYLEFHRSLSSRGARFAETFAARQALLGKNLSISYRHPLKIVRG